MAFVAGQKLRAGDLNAISTSDSDGEAADFTTSSTTFVDTTNGPSITFTAPPSGVIMVVVSGDIWSSSGSQAAELDYAYTGGSSRAAASATALRVFGANGVRASMVNIESGLTPGASYTIKTQLRSSDGAATAHAQNRGLIIFTLGA